MFWHFKCIFNKHTSIGISCHILSMSAACMPSSGAAFHCSQESVLYQFVGKGGKNGAKKHDDEIRLRKNFDKVSKARSVDAIKMTDRGDEGLLGVTEMNWSRNEARCSKLQMLSTLQLYVGVCLLKCLDHTWGPSFYSWSLMQFHLHVGISAPSPRISKTNRLPLYSTPQKCCWEWNLTDLFLKLIILCCLIVCYKIGENMQTLEV